jgi:hypothetical protein
MNQIIDIIINNLSSFIVFVLVLYKMIIEALHYFNLFWVCV